ncbi:MAG: ImmA/IrrE family metallo-endopeptidase [Propionibacteriales bacterium]|nr:ImmA/IrrE family metallo-endopeptidase [Propionibacteriales bacterium]
MQQITYRSSAAAVATRERFWLVDEIDELPNGHPVKAWVTILCVFARDVMAGTIPGPFTQARAERFAREVMLPAERFIARAHVEQEELAAHFNVPAEQVQVRFVDLADRLIAG